jgi:hypothetical protein
VDAQYGGSGNFLGTTAALSPAQLINTPPVAGADTIRRSPFSGTKVTIAALLANDYDADGDPITLVSLSTNSTYGGVVSQSNGWLLYTPPAGFTNDDTFTYTISDGREEPVTGTVSVLVWTDTPLPPNLVITNLGNGSYVLRFDGIPGTTYRIQYTEELGLPDWHFLGQATADDTGQCQFTDSPPLGAGRFYRLVYP